MTMLSLVERFISTLLFIKVHQIFIGKSPLLTEHMAETDSWTLTASSPNSKGTICGRTKREFYEKFEKFQSKCKILKIDVGSNKWFCY